jgi:uncharacterized protein (DUF1810 family)
MHALTGLFKKKQPSVFKYQTFATFEPQEQQAWLRFELLGTRWLESGALLAQR